MSKLNFAIALKMTTAQFQKGADVVKRGIKNIQYQVLGMASALGVGAIGLKGLVSQFVSVARETNRARVALKNISGDANGFANNMNFLIRTSTKWGQELNGMTSEYAKFSAAASSAGISIEDQQYIFDTFTRSITAFGMSSEEAHLSYLALSQMMSKGKVSSEELRRQLGEKMPIAMEAMARAAGVTIQELDKLLSGGKLISKDIMKPFMEEMEKMLPKVDVDNIETSVNRLRNTFTKLTQDLKVGDIYKKLVDGANNMLANVQTSFARISAVIISSIAGRKVFAAFMKLRANTIATNEKILNEKIRTEQQMEAATAKRIAAEKRYNDMSVLYAKASNENQLAYYTRMRTVESSMDKARLTEKAAQVAMEKAQAAKTVSTWTMAWNGIKTTVVSALATIRAMMVSIVPMAIIGLLTNFVMKLREARKEAERIKNIFNDNRASVFGVADTSEMQRMRTLHRIVEENLGTKEEINAAQDELLQMLGIEKGRQVDINEEVSKRISLLKEAARADVAAQNNAQLEQRNREIVRKASKSGDIIAFAQFQDEYRRVKAERGGDVRNATIIELAKKYGLDTGGFIKTDFVNSIEEFEQNLRAINDNTKILEDSERTRLSVTTTTSSGDPDKKESPLEKAEQKYADELLKLANQKAAGAIREEEYNKAIDDLNKATYEEIAGILGANAYRNETFRLAKKGVENQLSSDDKVKEITDELNKTYGILNEKKQNGLITEDEYNNELLSLIHATSDKIASLEHVGEAEKQYIARLGQMKSGLVKDPERKSRDTTFDYKKSESDKLSEELSLQEKYLEDVKEKYRKLKDEGVNALSEIAKEEEKVTSLAEKLTLARLKEDIDQMNFDIFSNSMDDISGFANSLDRISRSWNRIANEDMSGFERMIAIFKAMGDTIKGLTSSWKSYNAIKELISNRDAARQAQDNILSSQKIANTITEMAAEKTATASNVAGDVAEGASKAGVSAASLPFPANIATIPIAIAAALAAFKAIPGFNSGGIVGGSSHSGDRVLARVNSGEMILTTAQQSGLWNAIKNGRYGGGQGGELKLRLEGKDLVASLNQQRRYLDRR